MTPIALLRLPILILAFFLTTSVANGEAGNLKGTSATDQGDRFTLLTSWYGHGDGFHGRTTKSGEVFNKYGLTAASNSFPMGTKLLVTYTATGKSVVVRVNDTGGFGRKYGRDLDISYGAARRIGMVRVGVARLDVKVLELPRRSST